MGQARHPLSLTALVLALACAVASGCGSSEEGSTGSSTETGGAASSTAPAGASTRACTVAAEGVGGLRASGVSCADARGVVASWNDKEACAAAAGRSRTSCTAADYRCLGAATERGLAVSCARPGGSISFLAKRG